jgi:hypothetical protein
MSARKVVAYNVRAMMGVRPGLDDPKKLAKATIYPFGKKAGKNPSVRSIQYLISDSAGAPAAGLDLIAGVANAAPDERIPPQFSAKHRSPKATKK